MDKKKRRIAQIIVITIIVAMIIPTIIWAMQLSV
ncbi:Uncharacterised protein [uncultured Eubacterium sp.]|nr:Uncharacterised protein [uncultured Eubacterium sp.]